MLENCEPVRLSIDVFTVRINFNMNMSHTKEIPTRPIYDVLSNKCEIYKRALEQREKKLLWTWIYANLHTPSNPTFYENIRDTMWWRKKWTATVIHSPIDFLYVRKFGKPYIWGIWDNHTHMLCVGRTQQKMKFILRITMHFGPELNDIHMVNNNTSHKKIGSKKRKKFETAKSFTI